LFFRGKQRDRKKDRKTERWIGERQERKTEIRISERQEGQKDGLSDEHIFNVFQR
jgi:hypothetical protein